MLTVGHVHRLLPHAFARKDEIRQEFVVRAPSLGPERPQNSWEWYFLMQHSGAPTRLLDWTETALIAPDLDGLGRWLSSVLREESEWLRSFQYAS